MKIEAFMTVDVFTVSLEMTVRAATQLMTEKHISGAPVVDTMGKVITVISEGDLLKLSAAGMLEKPVATCLSKLVKTDKLITLTRGADFKDAYKLFLANSVHRIIIIDGSGKLQGIVSRSNILRLLVEGKKEEAEKPAEKIAEKTAEAAPASATSAAPAASPPKAS